MVLHRILFKLYHIQQALSSHAEDIRRQNGTLTTLRAEQRANDEELEGARAEQAKSRSTVMQKEKRLKKAEKALEGKVCLTDRERALVLMMWYRNPSWYRLRRRSRTRSGSGTTQGRSLSRLSAMRKSSATSLRLCGETWRWFKLLRRPLKVHMIVLL